MTLCYNDLFVQVNALVVFCWGMIWVIPPPPSMHPKAAWVSKQLLLFKIKLKNPNMFFMSIN